MNDLSPAMRMKRLTQKDLPKGFGMLPFVNQLPKGCRLYKAPFPGRGFDIIIAYATGEEDPASSALGREGLLRQVWGNLPTTRKETR